MARILGISTPASNSDAASKTYADTNGGFGALPTGAIIPHAADFNQAGIGVPNGFLVCDGTPISRTTHQALFDVICPIVNNVRTFPFGAGDGSTTFHLPNLKTKIPIGHDPSGTLNTLGASGGTLNHGHNGPSHEHGMSHSHSMQSHTHSYSHVHDISHSHTMGNHTHGMNNHVHSVPGHGHGNISVSISSDSHSHEFRVVNGTSNAGTSYPRSSDGGSNATESTNTYTHSHTASGRIGAVLSGRDGDGAVSTGGPSDNTTGAPSTNSTGTFSGNTSSAKALTTSISATANTSTYVGNTDLAGAVATTNNGEVPYIVLNYLIKT
jgi:microcystin-dependent protein